MKTYFYRGRIDSALRVQRAGNGRQFQEVMRSSVQAFGGVLIRCHLEADCGDPAGFLEFPDDVSARAWSTFYATQEGVLSSRINRMLDEDDLTVISSKITGGSKRTEGHRGG